MRVTWASAYKSRTTGGLGWALSDVLHSHYTEEEYAPDRQNNAFKVAQIRVWVPDCKVPSQPLANSNYQPTSRRCAPGHRNWFCASTEFHTPQFEVEAEYLSNSIKTEFSCKYFWAIWIVLKVGLDAWVEGSRGRAGWMGSLTTTTWPVTASAPSCWTSSPCRQPYSAIKYLQNTYSLDL